MQLPPLVLASASPRRKELLQRLQLEFRIVPSESIELHERQLTARELAQLNAYRKGREVAKRFPDNLVISADTLVYLDQDLFGKPRDLSEARGMLSRLQRATHQVVTGVCLIHLRAHRQKLFAETTNVTFKALDSEQIDRYLASIDPLDKAGGYAIQQGGESLVDRISGSYTNVVGLPLERLQAELTYWAQASV